MEKRKRLVILMLMFVFIIVSVSPSVARSIYNKHKTADAAVIDEEGKIAVPPGTDASSRGTEDNPFVVLEIVPHESFAEIGYMVAGQEPIDIDKLGLYDYGKIISNSNITMVGGNNGPWYSYEYSPYLAEQLGANYSQELVYGNTTWYGYFERVEAGLGDYIQKVETTDDGEIYQYIKDEEGDLKWHGCDYYDNQELGETDHQSDIINYAFENQPAYKAYYAKLVNNNYFLLHAIGLQYKTNADGSFVVKNGKFVEEDSTIVKDKIQNFHTKVITVTPQELNLEANYELIQRADLISISGASHDYALVDVWRTFRRPELFSNHRESTEVDKALLNSSLGSGLEGVIQGISFGKNDLTWEATLEILYKVVMSEDRCPILYDIAACDAGVLTTYPTNNIAKLGLMLYNPDPKQFYETYIEGGIIVSYETGEPYVNVYDDTIKRTTGRFTQVFEIPREGQSYSDVYDLGHQNWHSGIPFFLERLYYNLDRPFVSEYMYTYNSDNSMTQSVNNSYIDKNADPAFEYFDEYEVGEDKLSTLAAIHYLLQASQAGKRYLDRTLTILEIEPYAEFMTEDEWETYLKKVLPAYKIKDGNLSIVQMTSSEFIGKIEDLNASYDIIYIGTDTGGLNQGVSEQNYAYTHIGATAELKDEYNTEVTRYSGNDITKQKQEEIKAFIKAEKPVLLSNEVMKGSSVDQDIVDSATYMYALLTELSTQSPYKEYTFCERTMDKQKRQRLNEILSEPNCTLNVVKEPVSYTDNKAYINANPIETSLVFEFEIDGKEDASYLVNLYIDTNADGLFDETEQVELTQNDLMAGGSKTNPANLQTGTTYKLVKDVSNYTGILPWKLEIQQNSNTLIRSEQSGFSAISGEKEKIHILQILSDESDSIVLPTEEEVGEGIFKNTISKQFWEQMKDLKDYALFFDRITVAELEEMADHDSLDIYDYDMLIFGFKDAYSEIKESKTFDLIQGYADSGKAVIFAHGFMTGGFSGSNSRYRDLIGMDRFGVTPSAAWKDKDQPFKPGELQGNGLVNEIQGYSNQYIDVRKMQSEYNPTGTSITNAITQVNQGQIAVYPYVIGQDSPVAGTHAQYYQLDFEKEDIVVWYCLSENGYAVSPNDVRNQYYIYSRENIIYTGLGHTTRIEESEIQLFVNTIIAAYQSSARPPVTEVTNSDKSNDGKRDYLYVSFDAHDLSSAIGNDIGYDDDGMQYKRVYFTIKDKNIIKDANYAVEFSYMSIDKENETEEVTIQEVYCFKADGTISSAGKLLPGKEYFVHLPIGEFEKSDQDMLEYTIKTTLTYNTTSGVKELSSYNYMTLIRRGLFNIS